MFRVFKARREIETLVKLYPTCSPYLDPTWNDGICDMLIDFLSGGFAWETFYRKLESLGHVSSPCIGEFEDLEENTRKLWNKTISQLYLKLDKEIKPTVVP